MPERGRMLATAMIFAIGALAVAAGGSLSGLAEWQPESFSIRLIGTAIMLLAVPSLLEETLFRGALHPRESGVHRPQRILAVAVLFVLWHPLQHWTGLGPPWTGIFVTPAFLIPVSIAAVTLGVLREVSGSILPPIAFHWLMVCAWKFALGGPF